MGLFYLLTLYGFIRSVTAESRNCWLILSVVACLCGMATKQVMVTAPVLVLLYDRAFVSGSDSIRAGEPALVLHEPGLPPGCCWVI